MDDFSDYGYQYVRGEKVALHDDHQIKIKTPDDIITTNKLLTSSFMVKTEEEVIASIERLIAKNKREKKKLTWSRK